MMVRTPRVTLIHNETAGDATHSLSGIVKLIKRAGYRVRAVSSKNRKLDRVLDKPADLIAIAGGDGAITKTARKASTDGLKRPPKRRDRVYPLAKHQGYACVYDWEDRAR
jgi:diacylglycerol kinase family enzyme